jgi:hypothetical protein
MNHYGMDKMSGHRWELRTRRVCCHHRPLGIWIGDQFGTPVDTTGLKAEPTESKDSMTSYSWGAVFAEVAVDKDTHMVKVRGVVGTYDIGTLLNQKTRHRTRPVTGPSRFSVRAIHLCAGRSRLDVLRERDKQRRSNEAVPRVPAAVMAIS